jgi:hypothetical protein
VELWPPCGKSFGLFLDYCNYRRSIDDLDGPKIAAAFYEHLFEGSGLKGDPGSPPNLRNAAEALHFAVKKLRMDYSVPFNRWVPFIYYGV